MAFLTPDKIRTEHGLVIKEKIIPWGAKWTKTVKVGKTTYHKGDKYKADRLLSNGTGKAKKVTVHNTTDIEEAKGTNDAEQYVRATYPNQNMGDARPHYFVDETDCWQMLREDEEGWHAADKEGNETSIGIEIIMDGSGSAADKKAEDRGALLAAIQLNKHGLSIDDLVTHQYWSGKYCPAYILPHWDEFKAKVKAYLAQIQGKSDKTEATEPGNGIKAGDIVNVASNAVYYNGKDVPDFVVERKWIVKAVSGDRVVIDKSVDGKFSINSPVNVKYLTAEEKAEFKPYLVEITAKGGLNVRKGPGTNNSVVKTLRGNELNGIYTIVEEAKGAGATKGWGLLKAYSKNRNGWISLDFTEKA